MTDTVFQNWGGGGQFYLGKSIEKIEHEGMGTRARIETSQDAGSADQEVKWFLKVDKTCKLLWEAYFQLFSFPSFYSRSHLQIFRFPPPPPEHESSTQKWIKIILFSNTLRRFLLPYQI